MIPVARVLLEGAGGVFGDVAGSEVVRHFGDAAAEYQAIRDSVGVAFRSDLTRIRMSGRDPVGMLNGLVTNDLKGPAGDRAAYALMLTPKGRIITDLRVLPMTNGETAADGAGEGKEGSPSSADQLLVDFPAAAADRVAEHLKRYVPPRLARWETYDADLVAIGVYGPRSASVVADVLGVETDLAEDEVARATFGDSTIVQVGTRFAGGEPGLDLFVPVDRLEEVWNGLRDGAASAGGRLAGLAALEVLRVEAGRPRADAELTPETLPAEALEPIHQMERAISFTKGCYTGQEVVVRIAHRGHVNRLLRGLLLADAPLPAARAPLFATGSAKEVGWVTSAVFSPLMEQTIALGYLRREVEPSAAVNVGAPDGTEATVVDLPFAP